jgi:hypothetical protein
MKAAILALVLLIGCSSTDDTVATSCASTGGETSIATGGNVPVETGGTSALAATLAPTGGQSNVALSPTGGNTATGGSIATGGSLATGGASSLGPTTIIQSTCDPGDVGCGCRSDGSCKAMTICGRSGFCVDHQSTGYNLVTETGCVVPAEVSCACTSIQCDTVLCSCPRPVSK